MSKNYTNENKNQKNHTNGAENCHKNSTNKTETSKSSMKNKTSNKQSNAYGSEDSYSSRY